MTWLFVYAFRHEFGLQIRAPDRSTQSGSVSLLVPCGLGTSGTMVQDASGATDVRFWHLADMNAAYVMLLV
jgi:hypothetical protein